MGTWSEAILGNDTSCEVRERFLELYDNGEKPESIAEIILSEEDENLKYDRTNVWIGLALACWECKVLTNEILSEIKKIVETGEDIKLSKELGVDDKFLKKREKVLDDFVAKISKEKDKPRKRKKIPKQIESIYSEGMCCAYKNSKGKYIGIYITNSEHYKNHGEIRFFFLAAEFDKIPTIEMFSTGKLTGLRKAEDGWENCEYIGTETNISYEKVTKEAFYANVPQILTIIGILRKPDKDKLINDFKGWFMDLNNPSNIIEVLEKVRKEIKESRKIMNVTLGQLLEKVGADE